uniref:LEM domain-containing protein n=1 Tax=Steinernema glaseri TaxID=37863 RepID=A0A1I8A1J2_9BILA
MSSNSSATPAEDMSIPQLSQELSELGHPPGPINDSNKDTFVGKLKRLRASGFPSNEASSSSGAVSSSTSSNVKKQNDPAPTKRQRRSSPAALPAKEESPAEEENPPEPERTNPPDQPADGQRTPQLSPTSSANLLNSVQRSALLSTKSIHRSAKSVSRRTGIRPSKPASPGGTPKKNGPASPSGTPASTGPGIIPNWEALKPEVLHPKTDPPMSEDRLYAIDRITTYTRYVESIMRTMSYSVQDTAMDEIYRVLIKLRPHIP